MVYLGCDHGGFGLKQAVLQYLQKQGVPVTDCGANGYNEFDNFPEVVTPVVKGVLQDPKNRGILLCGTGIGMSIAANRHPGIRAALVHDVDYARLCRQHNDANVLCMGGRFMDEPTALTAVDTFLKTPMNPEPKYRDRMNMIDGGQ